MDLEQTFTAVYAKTAFEVYAGYIEEIPQIDSVCHSLDEVKSELQLKLDNWKEETGINYQIREVYRNI